MKTLRMTDRWVRTISVVNGREEFSDSVLPGLRLRVSARSRKWSVMTRKGGKQVRAPIGDYPEIGLGDARVRADRILNAKAAADSNGTIPHER